MIKEGHVYRMAVKDTNVNMREEKGGQESLGWRIPDGTRVDASTHRRILIIVIPIRSEYVCVVRMVFRRTRGRELR